MAPLVDARGLAKRHGRRWALADATLAVAAGEVVALVGENGAGKTTLLRLLATLDRPTVGALRIGGLDPREEGPAIRRRIGWAGHLPGLYDELTLRENLAFALSFHPAAPRDAAEVALRAFDLAALADARAGRLSRGERQRAALARAVAHAPDLLLLDEPFSGLDGAAAEALARVIRGARAASRSVVFSTHGEGRALADRVVRLHAGRLASAEVSA